MTAPPDLPRLDRWRQDWAAGGSVRHPLVGRRLFEPGERIAAYLPLIERRRVPAADGAVIDGPTGTGSEGGVLATDRRLLVKRNSRFVQEWRWEVLENVRVARTASGVVLVPTAIGNDGLLDAVVNVDAQITATGRVDHAKRDQKWWAAQGAFFASQGRLDEWWARVQAGDPLL